MRILLVIIAMLASCSIDHRTDSLQCGSAADCSDGRTCDLAIGGYCVTGGSSATMCPAACTSCDFTQVTPTCAITGSGSGALQCPSGFFCDFTCSAGGACPGITCGDDGCDVTCGASGSCDGEINCQGAGACQVACQVAGACVGGVTCTNSCKCDVDCSVTGSCTGALQCPKHGLTRCTTDGTNGSPCDSSAGGSCDQC